MSERLLPEVWPLHQVAKELGKATHVLVEASSAGTFPPVFRIGAVWHVRAELMRAWINSQQAPAPATAEQRERVRAAGQGEVSQPRARRRVQPRAHTAASS